MKGKFSNKTITPLLAVFFLNTIYSQQVLASDFSLPFFNASELGNSYAGWAASATDVSTAYSNPAGLVKLKGPQLVAAGVDVTGNTQFRGTVTTPFTAPQTGTGSGTAGGFGPLLYVGTPINKNVYIAFGANAPFGLGTNYPKDSLVRYLATRTKVVDLDAGPSIGIQLNDKFSVGFGLDIQRLIVTINSMYASPFSLPDSEGQNHVTGWGVGWHGGALYQFVPCTRVGFSFNSQTSFNTRGNSAVFLPGGTELRTTKQAINTVLPARAQLSIFHDITPCWAIMGTIFYTHWSILNQVTLQNTMIPTGDIIRLSIPFHYHDTFDYAAGLNFKPSPKWILRTGIQYFSTPSNNHDRGVADPVGQMVLVGIGAHYQQNAKLGYDLAYGHDFFNQTVINQISPVATGIGHSNTGSNVFGAQLTWNIC